MWERYPTANKPATHSPTDSAPTAPKPRPPGNGARSAALFGIQGFASVGSKRRLVRVAQHQPPFRLEGCKLRGYILARLEESDSVSSMALPGFRLHPLKGEFAGFWSVSISGNWRVIFRFEDGNAIDVDLVDYH